MTSNFLDYPIIDIPDWGEVLPQFEGNLDGKVLVIFPKDEIIYEQKLLTKIVAALKLSYPKDVIVLKKTKQNDFSFGKFLQHFRVKQAIIFGVAPQSLGIKAILEKYKFISVNDCSMLFSHSLSELDSNKSYKIKLWNSLKALFDLSLKT